MQQLLELLHVLKRKTAKKNIDIYITADNLYQQLIDSGIEIDDEKGGKSPEQLVFESHSTLFPYFNEQQEAEIGKLLFKFEVEHIEHVPTMFIHSKTAIEEETFELIMSDIDAMVEETASLKMVNPFLLKETHTYCVNLKYHIATIHGILNKNLYGKFSDNNDSNQNERSTGE